MKIWVSIMLSLFLLQTGFTQEVNMITDWEQAKELAQKENKQILVILTGSEWCAPCKKMDKRVIANPEFQKYVRQNLVLFVVDLPGGGLHLNSKVYQDYSKFKKEYQSNALPSLILTDSSGGKIKLLAGKMFEPDNVMKQLRSK